MSVELKVYAVKQNRFSTCYRLSIEDEHGGYRIAGPTFNSGAGSAVLKRELNEKDVKEIRRYLNKRMVELRKDNK